jgi:hypothetical protein
MLIEEEEDSFKILIRVIQSNHLCQLIYFSCNCWQLIGNILALVKLKIGKIIIFSF